MQIKTKYNLNDEVLAIRKAHAYVSEDCPTCKGSNRLRVVDSDRILNCPDCKFGKIDGPSTYKWQVDYLSFSKIGKIDVEIRRENESKTRYMLDATGIGSGATWPEENIFQSIDEAKLECEKRNEKI